MTYSPCYKQIVEMAEEKRKKIDKKIVQQSNRKITERGKIDTSNT
jgi:hypothetical protein